MICANPDERCIIVKISFTSFENTFEYQNILEGDLDFLTTDNQMQKFFNGIASDIYFENKWLPTTECLDEGEAEE